jgi:hypothetical protein
VTGWRDVSRPVPPCSFAPAYSIPWTGPCPSPHAANRKTCLLARPAMSLCARQHHSRDHAVSLPARSYSCNPSWGGGGGGGGFWGPRGGGGPAPAGGRGGAPPPARSPPPNPPPPPPQEAVETVLPFGRFFGCITQKGPKPTATVWPILYRRGRNGAELLKN